jgi:Predicted exporters of the RND superfamily
MEELAAYSVLGHLNDCDYVRSGMWRTEDWQVNPANLSQIMEGLLAQMSCFDESGHTTIESMYANELGWDGSSMQYAAISARTEVLTPFGIFPESVTRKEYDQFAKIANSAVGRNVSEYCYSNVTMTDLDRKFVFMNNQSIYAKSAVTNSIFGVAIAFLVLLVKTRVFLIALFACFTIACVLVSVVGVMVMLGWELGTMESILVGILSGFSVDYVIHLAHEYASSFDENTNTKYENIDDDTGKRVTKTFNKLGTSLFYGMLTSIFASLPLIIFCQLQFFAKFGIFFMLTISFAWLFANFFFMTLLAQLKIKVEKSGCCRLTLLTLITFIGVPIGVVFLYSWLREM